MTKWTIRRIIFAIIFACTFIALATSFIANLKSPMNVLTFGYTKYPPQLKPSGIKGVDAVFCPVSTNARKRSNLQRIEKEAKIGINYYDSVNQGDRNFKHFFQSIKPDVVIESVRQAGCYFSHLAAMEEIVARELNFTIIFEDDVDVERDFADRVASVFAHQDQMWPDIVLFGHCFIGPQTNSFVSTFKRFTCTHAYGITLGGAKQFIAYFATTSYQSVDLMMSDAINELKMNARGVFPPIVVQLPRGYVNVTNVSESAELPMQLLIDPIILANEDFRTYWS